jgi:very-short-patch-repair endonuclease
VGGGDRAGHRGQATRTASIRARELRNNLTDAERKLWWKLRYRQVGGYRFRRQVPIGRYIVDFACLSHRLLIELDGSQHGENIAYDRVRTRWLESRGYRVLRFWNGDVLQDVEGVLEAIYRVLSETPHPNPPPQGGRE